MRFTIKAKLATTFGAVIVLSMVAGGIAYDKLTTLTNYQDMLARQALIAEKLGAFQDRIQGQVRAEKNIVLSSDAKEIETFSKAVNDRRAEANKFRDEIYGLASDAGKQMMDRLTAKLNRVYELQDQVVKFGTMNSNFRASQVWRSEGAIAVKEFNAALDSVSAEIEKNRSAEGAREVAATIATARVELATALRYIAETFASGSLEELEKDRKSAIAQLDLANGALTKAANGLSALGVSPKNLDVAKDRLKSVTSRVLDIVGEGGNLKGGNLTMGEGRLVLNEALTLLNEYTTFVTKRTQEITNQAAAEAAFAKMLLVSIVIASALIGIAAALWISISISRNLSNAVKLADAVARGDLTETIVVKTNDEVGDLLISLNGTVERLRSVVTEALTAAQNVSAGSQELSASAEQLSQGATEQASSAEEASSSMEEMAANVKQNADNANQTERIAAQSAKDAEASGEAVGRAVEAMQTIAEKITIVQEIARQTDLLALECGGRSGARR